jgi:hypothetical protein
MVSAHVVDDDIYFAKCWWINRWDQINKHCHWHENGVVSKNYVHYRGKHLIDQFSIVTVFFKYNNEKVKRCCENTCQAKISQKYKFYNIIFINIFEVNEFTEKQKQKKIKSPYFILIIPIIRHLLNSTIFCWFFTTLKITSTDIRNNTLFQLRSLTKLY